jgi:hypothetical protein
MKAQGDQSLRGRCQSEIRDASSRRTTCQADHVQYAMALADLAQLRAGGRKESAQQLVPLQLPQRSLPAMSTTTQPLEDPGQLLRDRCLEMAKEQEPAGLADQLDIAP